MATYTYELAVRGTQLFAARSDGLWVRDVATVGVPGEHDLGHGPYPSRRLALESATPHPLRGTARLRFRLASAADVQLHVFDASGRRVARLVEGTRAAGTHEVTWNAAAEPAGLYLVRLASAGEVVAGRIVLVH